MIGGVARRVNCPQDPVAGRKLIAICDRHAGNRLQPVLLRPRHFLEHGIRPTGSYRTAPVRMVRMRVGNQNLGERCGSERVGQRGKMGYLSSRRIQEGRCPPGYQISVVAGTSERTRVESRNDGDLHGRE